MKKTQTKESLLAEIPVSPIVSVVKGAYEGYKTGGVSGAIAGGVKALLSKKTSKRWPYGAI